MLGVCTTRVGADLPADRTLQGGGDMSRNSPESRMQRALVQIVRLSERPGVVWHSIPNEGARSARFGAELKAMGLKPGVADMIFVIDGKAHYLELKAANGRLSETQRLFAADCRAAFGRRGRGLSPLLLFWDSCGNRDF